MSKLFYDHLIIVDDIVVLLEKHEVPQEERVSLMQHIDELLHTHILDTILSHLSRDHHDHFLDKLAREPHQSSILDFLKDKTKVDIEREIEKTVAHVKAKIQKDIEDSLEGSGHNDSST